MRRDKSIRADKNMDADANYAKSLAAGELMDGRISTCSAAAARQSMILWEVRL